MSNYTAYQPKTWASREFITRTALNHMEEGISNASDEIISLGETIGNLGEVVTEAEELSTALQSKINSADEINNSIEALIESIPQDYTELSGDVDELKSAIEELAENGYYTEGTSTVYIPTTIGRINNASPVTVDSTKTNTAYAKLTSTQETKQIAFDATKYKVNLAYFNADVKTSYTSWFTTSPVSVSALIAHDEVYINIQKLSSGDMDNTEILTCLSYTDTTYVGDLATKSYVNAEIVGAKAYTDNALASFTVPGISVIYPDGFTSRIMPNIYRTGRFYADIDTDTYKIAGGNVAWVATDGNDTTGDGSESNPYATITKGLSLATTVHIKAGTYTQGTHYATSEKFSGKNVIGHGEVILQNDASGHYTGSNGSAYIENITFKHGGSSNPAYLAQNTGSGQTVCFVDCTFRDGASNGLSVKGIDAVLVNCVAYGNTLDGFNYHDNDVSDVTYIPNVIEIDCTAYNNGSVDSGSDSCNGSTAHDGTKIIRLNGEYYSCYGGVIAEIALTDGEPTMSVNYGVLAHDSTGTGTYKASFWASINTQMYLYDCFSYGGDYDISAINDAKVVSWRLTTGRDEPAINEAATATVIQH